MDFPALYSRASCAIDPLIEFCASRERSLEANGTSQDGDRPESGVRRRATGVVASVAFLGHAATDRIPDLRTTSVAA